jgi:hypothetical protein
MADYPPKKKVHLDLINRRSPAANTKETDQ